MLEGMVDPCKFLIHDRDSMFSPGLDRELAAFGLRVLRTPVRAPQANAYCERLVGTLRASVWTFWFRSVKVICECR